MILTSGSYAWLFACQWIFECAVWHAMFRWLEISDDPGGNGGGDSGVTAVSYTHLTLPTMDSV